MKNCFYTLILCLSFIIANAQEVFMLSPIIVADEDKNDFESMQMKYVTPLAQDAVDGKSMKGWALLKKVPFGSPDNKINYMWVAVFDDINQMVNRKQWWLNSESKFGIPSEILYDGYEIEGRGRYVYKTERQIETDTPGKYIILNWATPKDIPKMIDFQDDIEKHFRKNIIKSGMVEWGMATRIIPQAKDRSTALWWDIYDSMENAMEHLAGGAALTGLSKEKFSEFNEQVPNGWDNRVIFEFVTGAQ